jgi:segregation and condensation protein A
MSHKIHIKDFEGPLELLLDLIESKKLSINEVSLGRVTEEYFSYLQNLKEQEDSSYHEEVASFLVIASTLMLIKSRSLLPGFQVSEEEDSDIKELEERLLTYKRIKEMAVELEILSSARKEMYTRSAFSTVIPSFMPPKTPLDLVNMLTILKGALAALPQKNQLPQKIVKKIVSLEEVIGELESRIEKGMVNTFTDFVKNKREKLDVVVSFLAMLELVKIGVIAVRQSSNFDLIHFESGSKTK